MYNGNDMKLVSLSSEANRQAAEIKNTFRELNDVLFDGFADTAFTDDLKKSLNMSMAMKLEAFFRTAKEIGVIENTIHNLVNIDN